MDWIVIVEKSIFGAGAALGFGILFNVPNRTLIYIALLGLTGVCLKNIAIGLNINIILACFIGASVVGLLSMVASKSKHSPPLVFSIPGVIPMVPGIFTYKLMLGMIKLTGETGNNFDTALDDTVSNGLKAIFILMSLAVGVSMPNLIFRKESFHEMTILSRMERKVKFSKRVKRHKRI
ncbi:MAG: threonine/serine exporter family protein [Paludibacteraceae bacterium]|nr:threonine/serine exporter family protein [Paludibacteraceae bacterium]